MPVSFSAFHWQPVRRTKKMASIAARSGTRGRWQPKGCGFLGGRSGSIRSHISSGMRKSRRTFCLAVVASVHIASSYHAYWDRVLADKRADLDLQISLLTEHEVTRMVTLVAAMAERMGIEEAHDPELAELAQDVAPEKVLDEMEVHEREFTAEKTESAA